MFGTVEIRLSNDELSLSYVDIDNVVWPAAYDGAFFPIGTTFSGRYLTFRRTYLHASLWQQGSLYLSEVRAYQVPNLL